MTAPLFLGARCAQLRVARAISQGDLAAAVGTYRPRVSLWERGLEQPQARYLPALGTTLRVPALWLLDTDHDDPSLAALRVAAGLSVPEVAEITGIPYTTYYRVESGNLRGTPPTQLVRAMARALHKRPSAIAAAADRSRNDRDRDRVPALRA